MSIYSIVFSPTGGTAKAAAAIAEGMGEHRDIDMLSSVPEMSFGPDDTVLIAVPSYGGRVPAPAAERLSSLNGNGASAVTVTVYGNRAQDDTLIELGDIVSSRGFRFCAAVEAVAEHSLMHEYGKGRPDDEDLSELREYGRKIMESISADPSSGPDIPGKRPYVKYGGVPLKPSASKSCVSCGRCARECPAGAIPLSSPRKTDRKKCISCMHCVKICPVGARSSSRVLSALASLAMRKACSGRKENRLYLP